MAKLNCRYEIFNIKNPYYQNDYIEGIFYLKNNDKKDKKLRKAQIQLIEIYGSSSFNLKEKTLQRYEISRGDMLKFGETKNYPFKFKLGRWNSKKVRTYRYWYLVLVLKEKTGIKLTLGSDKNSAIFFIPIEGAKYTKSLSKKISSNINWQHFDDFITCSECGIRMKKTLKYCEHCGSYLK
ncbi:MAG: hypothetical protein ACFFAS_04150 [Promethearchaeota archaeon]